MEHNGLTVLIVATVAVISSCQDCVFPTDSELENVIENIILVGENPTPPTVTVIDFHPVCLAFDVERDHYRGVSVVVQYTCAGNGNCPQGMAQEQIESECVNGAWSNGIQGSTDNTRSEDSEANFTTAVREDCSFCLSPELASHLSLTTESVTHCVGQCIVSCLLCH